MSAKRNLCYVLLPLASVVLYGCNNQKCDKDDASLPELNKAYEYICPLPRAKPARKDCYDDPLPNHALKTLKKSDVGDVLYFIGDVHGMSSQLFTLLSYIDSQNENSTILFVGDIVNRKNAVDGNHSRDVVKKLRGRKDVYLVRGNQDSKPLGDLATKGPAEALKLNPWLADFSSEDLKFLAQIPLMIQIPFLNITVVHAGLVPPVQVLYKDKYARDHMCSEFAVRAVSPGNSETETDEYKWFIHQKHAKKEGITDVGLWAPLWGNLSEKTCHGDANCHAPMVMFGHDAKSFFQAEPADHPLAFGLDTSCTYGYSLTSMRMKASDRNDRQYLQVDCSKEDGQVVVQSADFEQVARTQSKPSKFKGDESDDAPVVHEAGPPPETDITKSKRTKKHHHLIEAEPHELATK